MRSRKWQALAAIIPALAMVFTDQTVLPIALPTIQKLLGASDVQLQWCINSYLLVTASCVLVGGKLGDLIGHRTTFALGMALFAISSALCGLSPNISSLILFRGFQGLGAALMVPAFTPLLLSSFPVSERGKAAGINVSVSSLFLIFGPLIGGYLTQSFSWRWIFWINLPIAALGLFLIFLFLPRSKQKAQKFDPLGFIFFVIGCSSLVIVIMQGKDWGWASFKIISLIVIFCISALLLLWNEIKATHPFMDASLFRHPVYKAVAISLFATQFILMVTVYRSIFFQQVLDWSALKCGVIFFIASLPVLFVSPIGGILSDRFGPKLPISIGFLLLIYSFIWLAFFVQSSLGVLLIGFFAFSIGIPLIFTPSYSAAMGAIPPDKAGSAFGTLATIRSLAACLGVAVIGSAADNIQFKFFEKFIGQDANIRPLSAFLMESLGSGMHSAKDYFTNFPNSQSQVILEYLKKSQIEGFFYAHLAIALVLILAFFCVFMLYHRKSSHQLPSSSAEGWD